MVHWYALHSKPQKERQVAEHLRRNKVEIFLPSARVNPVNSRASAERAYFPCYLFAKADLDLIGIGTLRWTPGLRRMVEFGGQPAIVPDHFIVELKRRIARIRAAGGMAFDGLDHGDRVKIVGGPFTGYEAVFDLRLSGTDRVRVLLELIGRTQRRRDEVSRMIPLEINVNSIAKVKPKL